MSGGPGPDGLGSHRGDLLENELRGADSRGGSNYPRSSCLYTLSVPSLTVKGLRRFQSVGISVFYVKEKHKRKGVLV